MEEHKQLSPQLLRDVHINREVLLGVMEEFEVGSYAELTRKLGFSYSGAVFQQVIRYRKLGAHFVFGMWNQFGVAPNIEVFDHKPSQEDLKESDKLYYVVQPQ